MMKHVLFSLMATASLQAHLPTEQQTVESRKALNGLTTPYCTSIPEGGFVYFFNKDLYPFLEKPFDQSAISGLKNVLNSHLKIPFSREGFTMASTRRLEDELDETSYSAIWVRDACWHYFALAINDRANAKRLITNLLKFYSTPDQIDRFIQVISNPDIADFKKNPNAQMSVPLIRFSKATLSHHQVDGKDQKWNHLQFDSHGIFLIALTHALKNGIISEDDLTPEAIEVLALFPAFFMRTKYWERKDAGPWEEELMHNASTIGLIAAGLRNYKEMLQRNSVICKQLLHTANKLKNGRMIAAQLDSNALGVLYDKGLEQVEFNLRLGCEDPDLNGSGNYRRADAALLFLCLPDGALFYDNEEMIQKVLNITLSLVGPYGVFRYKLDAYQSMNYWIDQNIPSAIIGPKTVDLEVLTRFNKGYMPAKQPFDAQWFFDSIFASIYYHLCDLTKNPTVSAFYQLRGDIHLKRALGQFTGEGTVAANGEQLPTMSLPESINTVFDQQYPYRPMPSPICPLSWSVAAMRIALDKASKAHAR